MTSRSLLVPVLFSVLGACAADDEAPTRGAAVADPSPGAASTGPADAGGANVVPGATPSGAADGAPPATTAPAKPTRVPALVAHGKLGRTTLSCDDGQTWIENRSEDDVARCWDDTAAKNVECDHDAWSSTGLITAGDYFLASYGWGYPGVVRRSEDGITWEDVLPGHSFAGLSFGNGRVLATSRTPYVSTTMGTPGSWTTVGDVDSPVWNVRRSAFVEGSGGRFIISLESGAESDIRLSDDNGATWRPATSRPAGCAKQVSSIVTGAGLIVMGQGDGSVCWSNDRGETWNHVVVAGQLTSPVIFTKAGTFMAWRQAERWESSDGKTWTMTKGTDGVIVGAVAQAATGTFVAVQGGWQQWYEKQRFYRSVDGVNWSALQNGSYVKSHPITAIVSGSAKPSAQCPLP